MVNIHEVAGKVSGDQLLNADELLQTLFPPKSRPTVRWLRDQQKKKRVPFVKLGRLVFFDLGEVRAALRDKFTVRQSSGGAR